ncbi:hypothetical protein PP175_27875 (plasmid) [Aneurinibacillus sp. Ricciae_BoGa-3]|uniref:hypothetical protein n=1 Tax=Aneurinibacillus sp. Ricciae_BoGa-3 TaxID=3022697 RepID=UPI002341A96C|nr:hypothetical protein [Aneurinibacillus sp. Ricciae_BoGa-3]WCK57012.1 hypothetical protein PP175_27875 [Aneurinibacillus sp. Ricciae_BoGa-3]
MITLNNKAYRIENRMAQIGDLILTTIYVGEGYPAGSILKVHDRMDDLQEVIAYPTWYEKGMTCFGIVVSLETEDYEVLVEVDKKERETDGND